MEPGFLPEATASCKQETHLSKACFYFKKIPRFTFDVQTPHSITVSPHVFNILQTSLWYASCSHSWKKLLLRVLRRENLIFCAEASKRLPGNDPRQRSDQKKLKRIFLLERIRIKAFSSMLKNSRKRFCDQYWTSGSYVNTYWKSVDKLNCAHYIARQAISTIETGETIPFIWRNGQKKNQGVMGVAQFKCLKVIFVQYLFNFINFTFSEHSILKCHFCAHKRF